MGRIVPLGVATVESHGPDMSPQPGPPPQQLSPPPPPWQPQFGRQGGGFFLGGRDAPARGR